MTSVRKKSRVLLPTAGVVAAVGTAVSGWAPIAQSTPAGSTRDAGVRAPSAPAATTADGTYESCGAYFGFGKSEFGVLDVVAFDVADQNGADGVAHAVPTDTQAVLELTNEDGDVLECTPVEVTEEAWNAAMNDLDIQVPDDASLPPWPGPGHYAYPTLAYQPFIEGFGTVVDVGFKVDGIPDGHALVSPTGTKTLVQHYLNDQDTYVYFGEDPRVLAVVEAGAGAAARDAFAAALPQCDTNDVDDFSGDLADAINALRAYRGFDTEDPAEMGCFEVGTLNADVSLLESVVATSTYVEDIVLSLPEPATTTTTSTTTSTTVVTPTTAPVVTESTGATPVAGSPTYTG